MYSAKTAKGRGPRRQRPLAPKGPIEISVAQRLADDLLAAAAASEARRKAVTLRSRRDKGAKSGRGVPHPLTNKESQCK
jgi:hypothetical protein